MSERTRKAYDQWASTYDSSPNPQIVLEFPDVLGLLAPITGEKILDAACCTGRYTVAIAERGAAVIGLDFSAEMLALARHRMPATEFHAADLTKPLPFLSHHFDAVLCAQALKHIPDLGFTMRVCARMVNSVTDRARDVFMKMISPGRATEMLIGALLRVAQAIQHRIISELNTAGFKGLTTAHMPVLQYPRPDGVRPGTLAGRAGIKTLSNKDEPT